MMVRLLRVGDLADVHRAGLTSLPDHVAIGMELEARMSQMGLTDVSRSESELDLRAENVMPYSVYERITAKLEEADFAPMKPIRERYLAEDLILRTSSVSGNLKTWEGAVIVTVAVNDDGTVRGTASLRTDPSFSCPPISLEL